ncbi:hypothetical protein BT96DRAFT_1002418 [Gymnopus androsaceus JB14]|uniref:Uncharacterized protein n=1 Tax=Gymnopus androsaceus JB14 TaxID=1447944 RepID=A0A6A4GYX1_9AGAR|nr:hypothetical protein BT96DRAFT_1002418 [Gymnopus androsaceus JB14]
MICTVPLGETSVHVLARKVETQSPHNVVKVPPSPAIAKPKVAPTAETKGEAKKPPDDKALSKPIGKPKESVVDIRFASRAELQSATPGAMPTKCTAAQRPIHTNAVLDLMKAATKQLELVVPNIIFTSQNDYNCVTGPGAGYGMVLFYITVRVTGGENAHPQGAGEPLMCRGEMAKRPGSDSRSGRPQVQVYPELGEGSGHGSGISVVAR